MYTKDDAKMTQGFAILTMVSLHLFCRKASDFLGQPILWIDHQTPLLYWIGFFSEICVPLYSICAGYGYYVSYMNHKLRWSCRLDRAFKLLKNYWIILVMFVLLGIMIRSKTIPGSLLDFIGNVTLITTKRYNGTWWYLATYLILLIIPISAIIFVPNKMGLRAGIILCIGIDVAEYFAFKFDILPASVNIWFPIDFLYTQIVNLWEVIPFFWIGCIFCKHDVISIVYKRLDERGVILKWNGLIIAAAFGIIFMLTNIIHKAVLNGVVAITVFILFNIWHKSESIKKIYLYLGKHSTNIWLSHMFFISIYWGKEMEKLRYAIVVFIAVLLLCIIVSYIEKAISGFIDKLVLGGAIFTDN